MSSINTRRLLPALSAVAVAVSLAACNGSSGSSSSSSAALQAQAIDGYIVGGTVFCDGEANGATEAMGFLSCDDGTVLVKVSGGMDVGFDEDASNDKQFRGSLLAPADLGYVTPLSSIAVAMSGGEDGFDAASFEGSVTTLGEVLGFDALDLGANPADEANVALAALNAKVNQIMAGFGDDNDDYTVAAGAFAGFVKSTSAAGGTIDTTANVSQIMTAINNALPDSLKLEQSELDALVADVAAVNQQIDAAKSPADIGNQVAKSPVGTPALSLSRDGVLVSYLADGASDAVKIGLDSFESDTPVGDSEFATVIDGSGLLTIEGKSITVEKSLTDKRVDLGFSIVSVGDDGDQRSLSIATTKARVNAKKGDTRGLTVSLKAGDEVFIGSTSKSGTTRAKKIALEKAHSFTLDNGDVDVSFWRISDELEANGLADITAERGNYEMTVAIGGIRIDETKGGERATAEDRSVSAGKLTVNGPGYEGYVTFLPDAK